MCLNVNSKRQRPIPRTASTDMYVYKFMHVRGRKVKSPFRSFVYNLGQLYSSALSCISQDWMALHTHEVHVGFHTFKNLADALYRCYDAKDYVFVCIIPKGAKYFTGKFSGCVSYASDQLIMLDRNDPRSLAVLANEPPHDPKNFW